MEISGKLASKDTSKIIMLPSASKYVFIKFSKQCLNIINNKNSLNRLKICTKMEKRELLLKYQSNFYNVQSNNDVNHRVVKLQRNIKTFLSLNVISGESSQFGNKDVLRHYH